MPGRVFPVRQHFLEELGPSLGVCDRAVVGELRRRDTQDRPLLAAEAVAGAVEAVCRTRPPGAVLVFLEGMAEIKQASVLSNDVRNGRIGIERFNIDGYCISPPYFEDKLIRVFGVYFGVI